MKHCPQCNRTYADDALSFCLDDGSPLTSLSAPSGSDPGATVQYPSARATSPQPTIAYNPGQPPSPPTPAAWSPTPMPQPQKRSAWPWVLGIGAVLALMGIGLVIVILVVANISSNNNNNRSANNSNNSNNNNSRSANRNSNTNSNSNSTNSTASFTDDFSTQTWGTGPSQYGKTWYQNEEYHVQATKGGYIVMYAPKTGQYNTENATVRVGARNIDGTATSKGYGLLVHGENKSGQLEDYGFLIDTGDKGYYRIIQHKAGQEVTLVSWTVSSTIRTGTSPNQLEVRIKDRKLDFYINGQFVTSLTDVGNYLRGLAGFYSSDTTEVAFDDLEFSR